MGESCAIDPRVVGSNPAGQLLIYFQKLFPVLTKTLCQHSSLVPRSRIETFMRKLHRCSPPPSAPLAGSASMMKVEHDENRFRTVQEKIADFKGHYKQ